MELQISPFELAHLPVSVAEKRSRFLGSAKDDRGWWWDVWLSGKIRVRAYSGQVAGLSARHFHRHPRESARAGATGAD
jgi:hypothetical protein